MIFDFFKRLNKKRKKKRFQNNIDKNYLDPLKIDYKNFYKVYTRKKNNELSKLCEQYGSDKGYLDFYTKKPYKWKPHNYSIFYNDLFFHMKDEIKLVFECGIGTNDENFRSNMTEKGNPGASLKVWKSYFRNAEIYGADIDKKILFQEERIKTFYVDQTNKSTIQKMWQDINKDGFDLIIDDGLHTFSAGVTFFENSFSKLKKTGIYIIEDVHFTYLNKLATRLKDFEPQVIILNNKEIQKDNNLILIRKT